MSVSMSTGGRISRNVTNLTNECAAPAPVSEKTPTFFQHLRAATVRAFREMLWHPGPVPTLDMCGRPQIALLIRRTVRRCPIHCCAGGPPLFTLGPVDAH